MTIGITPAPSAGGGGPDDDSALTAAIAEIETDLGELAVVDSELVDALVEQTAQELADVEALTLADVAEAAARALVAADVAEIEVDLGEMNSAIAAVVADVAEIEADLAEAGPVIYVAAAGACISDADDPNPTDGHVATSLDTDTGIVSLWTRAGGDWYQVELGGPVACGAAWTPTDLSGLYAWYDFSDPTSLYTDAGVTPVSSDGDLIYRAADLSGNSRHLNQSSSGSRPLHKVNILNSLSVGRFDGSDDFMQTGTFGAALSQPYTIVLVMKEGSTGLGATYTDGLGASHRATLIVWFSGKWSIAAPSGPQDSGATLDTGNFHYLVLTLDGASSVVRKSGTDNAVVGDIGSNTMDGLTLAANYVPGGYVVADVAEVMLVSGSVTGTDLTDLETYLTGKYAL